MKVYLAGRYQRGPELAGYAQELEALGMEVTASWLKRATGEMPELKPPAAADEDLADIERSDVVIVFTEYSDIGYYTGDRHVELGYALGRRLPVWQVGPDENIFQTLTLRFPDWRNARLHLFALTELEKRLQSEVAAPA